MSEAVLVSSGCLLLESRLGTLCLTVFVFLLATRALAGHCPSNSFSSFVSRVPRAKSALLLRTRPQQQPDWPQVPRGPPLIVLPQDLMAIPKLDAVLGDNSFLERNCSGQMGTYLGSLDSWGLFGSCCKTLVGYVDLVGN